VTRAEVRVQDVLGTTVRDEFVPQSGAEYICAAKGAALQNDERQGHAQDGDRRQLGSCGRA
jgi:hypothetical protein